MNRCSWVGKETIYQQYHDNEWGYPVADDRTLYEKLCLESFQSGLAWITVLRKRDAFRRAFHNFEPDAVAAMTSDDVERLLGDASIIRHRGKIESAINNARQTVALQESKSLATFVWAYEPLAPQLLASQSPESVALSKALKKRRKKVELVEYEAAQHGIWRTEYRVDMLSQIGKFLDQNTLPSVAER